MPTQDKSIGIKASLSSELCANGIEQQIIRAYVQLVFQPDDEDGFQAIRVAKFAEIEVRLTEFH